MNNGWAYGHELTVQLAGVPRFTVVRTNNFGFRGRCGCDYGHLLALIFESLQEHLGIRAEPIGQRRVWANHDD
jgi:hypothetical protein